MKRLGTLICAILFVQASTAQYFQWARALNTTGSVEPKAVTTDNLLNTLTAGTLYSNMSPNEFGDEFFDHVGSVDMFVAKYGPEGQYLWAFNVGGLFAQMDVHTITTDPTGAVYVGGEWEGTVDFDPGAGEAIWTSNDVERGFFAKYSAEGEFEWIVIQNYGSGSFVKCSTVSPDGFVYFGGQRAGTGELNGPGWDINYVSTAHSGQIVKLNPSGELVAQFIVGSQGGPAISDIEIDNSGNLYFTGHFSGTAYFSFIGTNYNLVSSGSTDAYLAKASPEGLLEWAVKYPGTPSSIGKGKYLDSDASGKIYMAGEFEGSVSFTPTTHNSGNGKDVFIAKLDAEGAPEWSRTFGGTEDCDVTGMAEDFTKITLGGNFKGTVDFDPGAGVTSYTSAVSRPFVSQFTNAGNFSWAVGFLNDFLFRNMAFHAGPFDQNRMAGDFEYSADFNPQEDSYVMETNHVSAGYVMGLGNCEWPYIVGGIQGPTAMCAETEQEFSVTVSQGTTSMNWMAPFGTYPIEGEGTANVTYMTGYDSGPMYILLQNSCAVVESPVLYLNITEAPISNIDPSNAQVQEGNDAQFTSTFFGSGLTYTWQRDNGNGFVNLSNGAFFSGVNTTTLTVLDVPLSYSGDKFRLKAASAGCDGYSEDAVLTVTGIINVDEARSNPLIIYPNPASSVVMISGNTDRADVAVYDSQGRRVIYMNAPSEQLTLDITQLNTGVYAVQVGNERRMLLVE